jgi:hypothetical protein
MKKTRNRSAIFFIISFQLMIDIADFTPSSKWWGDLGGCIARGN